MTDQPRSKSVLSTIRPFRWRIAFTYTLTVIEDLLELSYPWATGLAINGLLAQDYRMIAPVMIFTQSPGRTTPAQALPARAVPTTRSVRGWPATSWAPAKA